MVWTYMIMTLAALLVVVAGFLIPILIIKNSAMAVEIKQINDGVYAVNDKVVKQNMDGNWVVSYGDELTPNEARALKSHMLNIEKNAT